MKLTRNYTRGEWKLKLIDTSVGTCFTIGPFPSHGVYPETSACVYADTVRRNEYGHNAIADELSANAALIAAAPELVEALAWLAVELEILADMHGDANAKYLLDESGSMAALKKAGMTP
jgi:hypothetical protein